LLAIRTVTFCTEVKGTPHRSAGLDQDVPDAVALRSADERSAGELRAVVGAHGSATVRHFKRRPLPAH
jgi:hypothetical protein